MRQRHGFISDEQDLNDRFLEDRRSIHSLSFLWGVALLIYLLGIFGLIYTIDNALPTALTILDEERYPESFIAERAIRDLQFLTNLGPRVVGEYENEILTVDFLRREIDSIIHRKHINQKLEVDFQLVSGAYYVDILQVNQINAYSNVQNVIVKIHGSNNSTKSILVNSHFDSVPTSPGGSDDGINVAAMLEILRKLSVSPERPLHNIVFLFNGAEETPLQASHGFITQHAWANECKVVVNLEACGHGGKIILFQTGPENPWLLKYYGRVPHPYGQAAGEEIFQSGLIPSDTDFRIFRDFGGLVGLDMAFYKSGYRYHTKYDDFENIPPGSYQHVGDNILFLVKQLANAPELSEGTNVPGKMVYFDILGLFMVSYTTAIAIVVNSMVIILSLGAFIWCILDLKTGNLKSILSYIFLTLGGILGGWILSGVSLVSVAYLLDFLRPMSWFANPWLIVGLYVVPTIATSSCLLLRLNFENLDLNIRSQVQTHIGRLIWTCILLIGTIFHIRSMYAIMVPVLFNAMAFLVIYILGWQRTLRKWQIAYIISLVIPTALLMYQMLVTLSLFIPLTGRMGSDKHSELIVGSITVFFALLITSPYVTLITLLQKPKYFYGILAIVFSLCFIVVFTPMGFPYSGNSVSPAPQRQWITHTKRLVYDKNGTIERTESGLYFLNMDRNSPGILRDYVTDLDRARDLDEDCKNLIVCGLPISHARMIKIMNWKLISAVIKHYYSHFIEMMACMLRMKRKYSTWIPAPQPILSDPLEFIVNSKEIVNSTYIEYNITLKGPDRISIYIVPQTDMRIVDVILLNTTTSFSANHEDKELIFILFTSGKNPATMSFTFGVEVPEYHNDTTCKIAVAANYVHSKKNAKTPYFTKILGQLPEWADVVAYLGTYSLYNV
ncbi:unnamed protein product [Phaedon cochleariae]|uniref:FXNA-like protease n=1 Tax=Phaedon cochleariae TaxID=80249 RepID=A0A9P0GUF6_PHACE|nr:unnamed protein product [Phaedon cochleariae]